MAHSAIKGIPEAVRRPCGFGRENEIADALRAIREQALWIKPSQRTRACSAPDDNIL